MTEKETTMTEEKTETKETSASKTDENLKEKIEEKKVESQKLKTHKKTEATVNAVNLPLSTKYSAAVCKFIKRKKIDDAIADLEAVAKLKKVVPMTGEIPHRKGKGMMSGRFPQKTAKNFIVLLKSLKANAIHNGIENPAIYEAVANIGSRPYGRFGAVRKKRTHIKIVAREIKEAKK